MICLAADIHGKMRLPWLSEKINGMGLGEDDFLVILGDAGIVWREDDRSVLGFYDDLRCRTLFVDGNHENFDLLESLPVERAFGGRVHAVSDRVYHLMRGERYEIDGRSVFAFGGGFSARKLTGDSAVPVWDREMPDSGEYARGRETLKRCGGKVDLVLTHVAPTKVAAALGRAPIPEERELNDYLEEIGGTISFGKWCFGHYHTDASLGRYEALYDRTITIGD